MEVITANSFDAVPDSRTLGRLVLVLISSSTYLAIRTIRRIYRIPHQCETLEAPTLWWGDVVDEYRHPWRDLLVPSMDETSVAFHCWLRERALARSRPKGYQILRLADLLITLAEDHQIWLSA